MKFLIWCVKINYGYINMKNRSFISKIVEIILKSTKPKYMDSYSEINEFLTIKSKEGEKPVKSIFKSRNFNGITIFDFGNVEKSENIIIYVHGGAYVNEINYQHLLFCKLLSRKLDAYVLAPVYPLAPLHNAMETFDMFVTLYKEILTEDANIILMGDSAGGGFVLSFCQYLKTINLPQPNHIVVFSPWVDISMSNPPYDSENDCILGEIGLREIGKAWAGGLNTKDYRVSPVFGDNKNLPKTMIFAGSGEIFYKDIKNYVKNLKNSGVDVKFITGDNLFHIYPLFPIPEAKRDFKILKNELAD